VGINFLPSKTLGVNLMPLFTGAGGGLLKKPTTGKLMRAPSGECCCWYPCGCCVAFKDVTGVGGTHANNIGVQATGDMSTNIHEDAYCDQAAWTFSMTTKNLTGSSWTAASAGNTVVSYLLADFEFVSASPAATKTDNGTTETLTWAVNYSAPETKLFTVTFRKKNCGTGDEYDISGGVEQGKDATLTIEQITCS
jgi:hypothetical protein